LNWNSIFERLLSEGTFRIGNNGAEPDGVSEELTQQEEVDEAREIEVQEGKELGRDLNVILGALSNGEVDQAKVAWSKLQERMQLPNDQDFWASMNAIKDIQAKVQASSAQCPSSSSPREVIQTQFVASSPVICKDTNPKCFPLESLLSGEKSVTYYALGSGSPGCPPGDEIETEQVCILAASALGLCHSSPWVNTYNELPRFCSHRSSTCGRSDVHFNSAGRGAGRSDMRPLCMGRGSVSAEKENVDSAYMGCYVENSGPFFRQSSPQWCTSLTECQCSAEFKYIGFTNFDGSKAEWSCFHTLPPVGASDCNTHGAWHAGARDWRASVYRNPNYNDDDAKANKAT